MGKLQVDQLGPAGAGVQRSMIMAVSRRASKALPAQAANSRRSPSSGITGTGWSGTIGGRILAIGLAGSSSYRGS